jgi:hypothetical protein
VESTREIPDIPFQKNEGDLSGDAAAKLINSDDWKDVLSEGITMVDFQALQRFARLILNEPSSQYVTHSEHIL